MESSTATPPPGFPKGFEEELAVWASRTQALDDSLNRSKAARQARYAKWSPGDAAKNSKWKTSEVTWTIPLPGLASLDPNTVDSLNLARMSLKHYLVQRWLKYRKKGGSFSNRRDIAKLYGLEDSTFRRILPYFTPEIPAQGATPREATPAPTSNVEVGTPVVQASALAPTSGTNPSATTSHAGASGKESAPKPFGKSSPSGTVTTSVDYGSTADANPHSVNSSPRATAVEVDLNSCTPVELEALRGIGPFYAQQIIDYRDRLGGFTSEAQYQEVPKVPDSVFTKLRGRLTIDLSQVRKIQINAVTAEQLGTNPYLTRRQANTVVAYRDNHGPFEGEDDLQATVVLTPKLIQLLAPYLNFSLGAATAE